MGIEARWNDRNVGGVCSKVGRGSVRRVTTTKLPIGINYARTKTCRRLGLDTGLG
jgi:hypothetical protein